MRRLFAGPWLGEFGWELCQWQAHVRHLARDFDHVVVSSRSGHEPLYEDFMDEFVPYNPVERDEIITGADRIELKGHQYDNLHLQYIDVRKDVWFPAQKCLGAEREFVKWGRADETIGFDLVIHARNTDKNRSGDRNWPASKWHSLLSHLGGNKIACIGTVNNALSLPGVEDLRGIPLGRLMDVLASSKLLVGPSSGAMHLGSLCGTPHIVWGPRYGFALDNKVRYEEIWNPFGTSVVWIGDYGWQPPVSRILAEIEKQVRVSFPWDVAIEKV